MPLSFPSSPSVGQQSQQNGRTYKWTGSVWEFVSTGGGGSGLSWSSVPASATASGTAGQIAYDANNFYVCTATNTWGRAALSTTWPVTTITGLQLWLDASAPETLFDSTTGGSLVAADGGVARWEDKSGNARHFTQSTSGNRPLRKTGQQNGLGTLLFAAGAVASRGDDILIGSDFGDYLQSGQSATVFVVFKTLTSDVRHELINKQDASGGWRFLVESDNKVKLFFDDNSGGRTTVETASTVSTSSYSVLVFKASGGSLSSAAIYKNGASLPVSASGSVQSVDDNSAAVEVGGGTSGGVIYDSLNGDIGEIIIYNAALSDTDRASVESYLIAKWGITPAPVPQTIAGLQLWLDASDASTLYDATTGGSLVAADGGVARWEDKSGNARHATQGTSANRPARKTAVQGGKDVLRFDGSNDSLSIPSSTETFKFLHSADSTVFVVLTRSTTDNSAIIDNCDDGSSAVGFSLRFLDGSGTSDVLVHRIRRGVSATSALSNVSANGFMPSGWSVLSSVGRPGNATASNRSSMRLNSGTAVTNNTDTNAVSTSNAANDLCIGRFVTSPSANTHGGDIAEIIIYNSALSDTDRAAVESYLIAKWVIA
jgi:hypothetical protein